MMRLRSNTDLMHVTQTPGGGTLKQQLLSISHNGRDVYSWWFCLFTLNSAAEPLLIAGSVHAAVTVGSKHGEMAFLRGLIQNLEAQQASWSSDGSGPALLIHLEDQHQF